MEGRVWAAEGFEEFVAIVDAGSLTEAARVLGVPRPTLSRRLARLEERLGVRLLHRNARRLVMTPAGRALEARARQVVVAAREVEAEVRRLDGVPRGVLRVSIPMGMGPVVAGWMSGFLQRHPEVHLQTVASAEHVDLVSEGFDVAVRVGPIEDPSLVARTLFVTRSVAVASPAYLARHAAPSAPDELVGHDCLIGYRAGRVPETVWPLWDGGTVPVTGRWVSNDATTRFEGARRGLGIALVQERLAAPSLQSGELVAVLPDRVGREERVSAVYPDRTFLPPKVRAFVVLLTAYFSGA